MSRLSWRCCITLALCLKHVHVYVLKGIHSFHHLFSSTLHTLLPHPSLLRSPPLPDRRCLHPPCQAAHDAAADPGQEQCGLPEDRVGGPQEVHQWSHQQGNITQSYTYHVYTHTPCVYTHTSTCIDVHEQA